LPIFSEFSQEYSERQLLLNFMISIILINAELPHA
jgi:hypothetical protein